MMKSINGWKPPTIFAKRSTLDIWLEFEYPSNHKKTPVTPLSKVFQNNSFFKDTHREKLTSNKIPALSKSMNMDIWVVGTTKQLLYKSFLTKLTGENCVLLSSVHEWLVGCFWPFHIFTQSIKFYTFYCHVLRVQVSIKCDCLLLSASFTTKFGSVFVLENAFS